ncbi:unnamed protein product [Alternaria burnsii]|nr:unnamed protein product [Alternaria burnsii]
MTITTNPPVQQTFLLSPTPTTTTFHVNPPTLPPFAGCQTFLLSATSSSSSTSIRGDSPILPPSPVLPPSPHLALFRNRHLSTPISTLPAYPTPRSFHHDGINSNPSLSVHSSISTDLSTADTAVENNLAPQTTHLSDILPSDMGLYAEEHEEHEDGEDATRWSRDLTEELLNVAIEPDVAIEQFEELIQVEAIPIREENVDDVVLGPEIQVVLPIIKGPDFNYYPPPSHPAARESGYHKVIQRLSRRLVKKNRGDGSGNGFRILWRRIQRKIEKIRKL